MNAFKHNLMERLAALGLNEKHIGYSPPLPFVSLEEFFEGNDDPESLAVNLLSRDPSLNKHPGLDYFYTLLKEIRARPDVQDVLVEVFEIETALQYVTTWPFAEKVYFFTSASVSEVKRWNMLLRADGPVESSIDGTHTNEPKLMMGYRVWYVVWD